MRIPERLLGPIKAIVPVLGFVTLVLSSAPANAASLPPPNGNGGVVVSCGPDTYSYCYGELWDSTITYQSNSTYPIAVLFNSGSMESCCDRITVYDGLDINAPQIYMGNGNFGDMTGLFFNSTNPDRALTIVWHSDGSISCQSGSFSPLNWTVSCLDCINPTATFDLQLDCADSTFSIAVDVTSIGSDPQLDVTNTGGLPTFQITEPGSYSVGPFSLGQVVSVSLENDQNPLCSVHSAQLTNSPCPVISCGPDNYTYCYGNSWDSVTVYQSASTYPIAVLFNSGNMESCCDRITVYDGPNTLTPPIYDGNGNAGDMTGLFFASTNVDNALTIVWHSDGSINCSDGSWGFATLDWTVSCLDCVNPAATFQLVPACQQHGYMIAVDVTNTGGTGLTLVNSYDNDSIYNVGLGTTMVGPIPVDEAAHVTVLNGLNPLCKIISDDFIYPADSCVITSCVPSGTEYCYQNGDTAWFTYASGSTYPITITFGWGQLLVNDYIQIYNGADTTAQLIYMGNPGGDLEGLAINSSNFDNALTLLIISNGAGACATGQAQPMYWSVGCGLVGVDERMSGNTLAVFPNPASDRVHIRVPPTMSSALRADLMDVTGRLVRSEQFNSRGNGTLEMGLGDLPNGNYSLVITTSDTRRSAGLQVVR